MSYILDALRKSDLERKRGQVPSLSPAPLGAPASAARVARWPWALALLLAVNAVVLAAWMRPWEERPAPLAARPAAAGNQPPAGPVPTPPDVSQSARVERAPTAAAPASTAERRENHATPAEPASRTAMLAAPAAGNPEARAEPAPPRPAAPASATTPQAEARPAANPASEAAAVEAQAPAPQ